MKPDQVQPVKLIIGFIYASQRDRKQAEELLQGEFGRSDYQSREYFFDKTRYYESEMGSPLFRSFQAYERLVDPAELAEIKLQTNLVEEETGRDGKRRVNLDPGYLDYDKLVLASAKYNFQKIYLGKGIYADPTLYYSKGRFQAADWAFPDFKMGIYEDDFLHIRHIYKKQLQEMAQGIL